MHSNNISRIEKVAKGLGSQSTKNDWEIADSRTTQLLELPYGEENRVDYIIEMIKKLS